MRRGDDPAASLCQKGAVLHDRQHPLLIEVGSGCAQRIDIGKIDERTLCLVVGRRDTTFGKFVGTLPARVEICCSRAQVGFPPSLPFGLNLFAPYCFLPIFPLQQRTPPVSEALQQCAASLVFQSAVVRAARQGNVISTYARPAAHPLSTVVEHRSFLWRRERRDPDIPLHVALAIYLVFNLVGQRVRQLLADPRRPQKFDPRLRGPVAPAMASRPVTLGIPCHNDKGHDSRPCDTANHEPADYLEDRLTC